MSNRQDSDAQQKAAFAAQQFRIAGEIKSLEIIDIGHINTTYLSVWSNGLETQKYIHQCVNHHVFPDVPGVMKNIDLVTRHLKEKYRQLKTGTLTLELVPTRAGVLYYKDTEGNFWRTFQYVEDAEMFNVCPDSEHAYAVGEAFGSFTKLLSDLPSQDLSEPIVRFQDVGSRFEALEQAIVRNPLKRVELVQDLIGFAREHKALAFTIQNGMAQGKLPLRITHADPKVNNVLFYSGTSRVKCVVDLDTVMPGTVLYDFGDMVRSAGVAAAEDEEDLSKVYANKELCLALTRGYLKGAKGMLSAGELELLPLAPQVIALSLGMRFLADYLLGDQYFKVRYPEHNRNRARTQFAIVKDMGRNADLFKQQITSFS